MATNNNPKKKKKPSDIKIGPAERKLLDFIGRFESKGGDYNIVYGKYKKPLKKPLTEMTLNEVYELQKDMAKEVNSSAVGAHQFIQDTLKEEAKKLGLKGTEKFTPELQDSLMVHRLKRYRGFDEFMKGELSAEQFGKKLSQEFASIPNPETGRSYYDGDGMNKSLVDVDDVLSELKSIQGYVGDTSVNPETIINNPDLDDNQKEELLRANESEGLAQSTADQVSRKPSILHELGAYTGYKGQILNEGIVDKDMQAKEKKLAEQNAKRPGYHEDLNYFNADHNLLDKEFNQGGSLTSNCGGPGEPPCNENYLQKIRESRKGVRKNPDGSESTHLMAYSDNHAYPTLFQKEDGSWYELPDGPKHDWAAKKEAIKKKEFYTLKNAAEAKAFAGGAWKNTQFNDGGNLNDNDKKKKQSSGDIKPYEPQGLLSKAWDIASNPMTALEKLVKTGTIPDNLDQAVRRGEGDRNILDTAMDVVNPFAIARNISEMPTDIKNGDYLTAGLNGLDIVPGGKAIGKGAQETLTLMKYKKYLKEQTELLSSPEGIKRLENLGVDPDKFKKYLDEIKLTVNRSEGSYFQHDGKININPRDAKKIGASGFRSVFDHELGHVMQHQDVWKTPHPKSPKNPNFDQNVAGNYHNISTMDTAPTSLDEALGDLDVNDVIYNAYNKWQQGGWDALNPSEAKALNHYTYFTEASQSYGTPINNMVERMPFLREYRNEMLEKGYIKNKYDEISPEMVAKFRKEHPDVRLNSFTRDTQGNNFRISEYLKVLPATGAAVTGGAALKSNQQNNDQQFNDGGMLTEYNEGGSHEQNPQGGIPVGMNAQGGKNLVEQGETRHDDYIYSNEKKLSKEAAERFNISPKFIGKSYSDISRDLNKEIKDRPYDKITKQTAKGNLNKIMLAQEFVKTQEQEQLQQQTQMQPQPGDQSFLGGGTLASGVQGALDAHKAGIAADGSATGLLGKAGGAMGIAGDAMTLAKFANTAFGKTGIDTSGTGGRQAQVKNAGFDAAAQGVEGAMAGMKYGPAGAIIGAGLGVGSSLMGSENKRDDIAENNRNASYIANNQHHTTFHNGGSLLDKQFHSGGNIQPHMHPHNPSQTSGTSFPTEMSPEQQTQELMFNRGVGYDNKFLPFGLKTPDFNPAGYNTQPEYSNPSVRDVRTANEEPQYRKPEARLGLQGNDSWEAAKELQLTQAGNQSGSVQTTYDPDGSYYFNNPNGELSGNVPELATNPITPESREKLKYTPINVGQPELFTDAFKFLGDNSEIQGKLNDYKFSHSTGANTAGTGSSSAGNKGEFNPGELLRFAPMAGKAMQLLNMDKPEVEKYDRLDGRYKPQYMDERSIENRTANSAANTRNALQNTYGGSAGAARSSLLASQLNEGKALSDSMMQAQQYNNQQDAYAQQFNGNLDAMNQRIGMQESVANSQNRAAVDTYRKQLINGLADDAGAMGKEEFLKDMFEKISGGYNSKGVKNQEGLLKGLFQDGDAGLKNFFQMFSNL